MGDRSRRTGGGYSTQTNGYIGRREFDEYRRGVDEALRRLEGDRQVGNEWHAAHAAEHDEGERRFRNFIYGLAATVIAGILLTAILALVQK